MRCQCGCCHTLSLCFNERSQSLTPTPLLSLTLGTHLPPTHPLAVKPMLAKATNGVQEVLDKFEGRMFSCEYKYDGERAQVRAGSRHFMY